MTTLGSDFAGVDDIDADWTFETDEIVALQQALARRLICMTGQLFYAPTYGYDLRNTIADTTDEGAISRLVDAEIKKDQRVGSSLTQVSEKDGKTFLDVGITVVTGQTFSLTLQIDGVTVSLLNGGT